VARAKAGGRALTVATVLACKFRVRRLPHRQFPEPSTEICDFDRTP
jgi:hypothetical protein